MAIKVSQPFQRTSSNPIDETLTLTKAQMLTVNDNLMPNKYFTICQDDGFIYIYDKSNPADPETGKFLKLEAINGKTPHIGDNGNWWIDDEDTGIHAQGEQGETGPQGTTGETGSQGATGETGSQGTDGLQGEIGPQGVDGIQGATGETGPQGIDGLQGTTGSQGTTGETGAQGPMGPAFTYNDFTQEQLQGLVGPQGPVGPQGTTGETGSQGTTGSQGPTGTQGADGLQGAVGQTGAQGSIGLAAYNPFKGTFRDGDTLPTTGQAGDYIYVVFTDTSGTDPVITTKVYNWDGTEFSDTGETSSLSDAEFKSGERVSDVNIIHDPTLGGLQNVLSGEVGKDFNQSINSLDLNINGGIIQQIIHHGYDEFTLTSTNVSVRGTGNITTESFCTGIKLSIPQNATSIKSFCYARNTYYYGISFYSSASLNTSTFIGGNDIPESGNTNQEVTINIPPNASYILVSIGNSSLSEAYIDFILETEVQGLDEKVTSLSESISQYSENIEDIQNNLNGELVTDEFIHGSDEFNRNYVVNRNSNGNISPESSYRTIFLPIPENTVQIDAYCYANNSYYNGVTFFKGLSFSTSKWLSDYPRVSGISNDGLISITDIPENAKAIAVTALASDNNRYIKFITQSYHKGLNEKVSDIESNLTPLEGYFKNNHVISSHADLLNQDDELLLNTPNSFKNYSIGCSMNFESAFNGRISLESSSTFNHAHIEIDETNLYLYDYRDVELVEITVPHGLTISQFLSISIIQTNIHLPKAKIIICSQSGMFVNDENINYPYWYAGGNVPYILKMINGSCINANLNLSINNCNVWLFGDSYLDYLVRNVTTTVSNELINLYMDGYPGRTSTGGLNSLNKAIKIANPKILVWALGMNDGDNSNSVNSDWLSVYNSVKDICKSNGIELVLVTIPTTPNVNNNYKNEIIKSSGYRYIDVAAAVGADGTGSWYNGMLSGDNVHPTSVGAKVIMAKYISDLPNIF